MMSARNSYASEIISAARGHRSFNEYIVESFYLILHHHFISNERCRCMQHTALLHIIDLNSIHREFECDLFFLFTTIRYNCFTSHPKRFIRVSFEMWTIIVCLCYYSILAKNVMYILSCQNTSSSTNFANLLSN